MLTRSSNKAHKKDNPSSKVTNVVAFKKKLPSEAIAGDDSGFDRKAEEMKVFLSLNPIPKKFLKKK